MAFVAEKRKISFPLLTTTKVWKKKELNKKIEIHLLASLIKILMGFHVVGAEYRRHSMKEKNRNETNI